MEADTSLMSPAMQTLMDEIDAGNSGAVETFWRDIGHQGAPLIEAIPGDYSHSLVSFVWRATEGHEEVEVVSNLPQDSAGTALSQLRDSDIWLTTYKVHNQTRESYQFKVGDDNVPDPLNPRQHVFPNDEENGFKGWVSSVLEMPDAPPQPWSTARPHGPHGQVTPHRIRSRILDQEYRIWVYTPHGYRLDGDPYGLLLILDGWFYIHLIPTHTILDNLRSDNRLLPLMAIMVGSVFDETRRRDLSCYPPFADFLTEEILPWARTNYHLSTDPIQTSIVGASRGGLMAAYLGLRHSEIFGNVISQSGAFWYRPEGEHEEEWLARQYVLSPKLPLRFHLDVGMYETEMDPGDLTCMLSRNRHMRDVLEARGYPVHYSEFFGGHNPMNWPGTLAEGLIALLGTSAVNENG